MSGALKVTIPSSPIIIGELNGVVDPHLRVEWRMFFNEMYVRSGGSTWTGPGVGSWNGRTGAVTMTIGDITGIGGAPIASPAFSGNPTAPTPPPGDNDTSVATTAFVQSAGDARYLPLTGGTLTGDLHVQNSGSVFIEAPGAGYPSLVFNRAAGGGNSIDGQTAGSNRWIMRLGDNDAETGGNAGSSFNLYYCHDDGSQGGVALSSDRKTGSMVFGGNANGVYPATAFGWASAFNVSGGQGEADFINLYPGAVASFSWRQMTATQTATNLMQLAASGVLTLTGPLVLPADPTTAMQAATKQYVDSINTMGWG
jgi:hypothetical protein